MTDHIALGDLAELGNLHLARGVPTKRSTTQREVTLVTPSELLSGRTPDRFTSIADLEESGALACEPGDLLVTLDGGQIGTAYLVREPLERVAPSQGTATLRVLNGEALVPGYLYAWIKSPGFQEEASRRTRGVAMQHLAWRDFVAISVPLPAIAEQRRIAELFEGYADAINAHQRSISVMRQLEDVDLQLLSAQFAGQEHEAEFTA